MRVVHYHNCMTTTRANVSDTVQVESAHQRITALAESTAGGSSSGGGGGFEQAR